ncbi:MAG: DUF2914 domain-containing protein [Patescibacteria group bacterium]
MVIERINSLYSKYESHLSSLFLIGGFVFDILTLRRADTFWENFWIVTHLSIVAVTILILNRGRASGLKVQSKRDTWPLYLLQFSFGGLLSAFLILYFRSAALSASWPFIVFLAVAFLLNERLRNRYERLTYQVTFFFLALLLFFIYFIPVVMGVLGPAIFVFSCATALVASRLFLAILGRWNKDGIQATRRPLQISLISIFVVINVLYFTNIIPPIPLSLREGNIYHYVVKDGMGNYSVIAEEKSWLNYFKIREQVTSYPGESLYAYTAIFSPARFNTKVVHKWQYYDLENGDWITFSKITLNTSGGRDNGYRTYSMASVTPGIWRVEVLTPSGQVLGRIGFEVKYTQIPPKLVTEVH